MGIAMNLKIDGHSPIPIRRQLAEQLKHVIESGGVARDQALPSIRRLAGFLGINTNTVARVVEDLKQSGYVEARRGKGVFVAPAPPVRPAPHLREGFLQDTVMRAAAIGMTADDLAVAVLSVASVRPAAVQETVEVLLVECSPPELDFFAGQLEAHLPVRVDKVLLRSRRVGPGARGPRRAGDDRRPRPGPASDRDARRPPGAAKRRQAGGGSPRRPEAPEPSCVQRAQTATRRNACNGAGAVMRARRNGVTKEDES